MRKLNCIRSSKPKGPEITHSAPGCLLAVLNRESSILVSFCFNSLFIILLCVFHCRPQNSNVLKWLLHVFIVLPYVGFFIIPCSSTEDLPFFFFFFFLLGPSILDNPWSDWDEFKEIRTHVKFWVLIDPGFSEMISAKQIMLLSLHIKYCKKLEILRPQRR